MYLLLLKFDMLRMQSLRLPASVCSAPGTAIVDVIATPGVCALKRLPPPETELPPMRLCFSSLALLTFKLKKRCTGVG